MKRIGIDVGGTNTDAVLIADEKVVHSVKRPTTADVTSGIPMRIAATFCKDRRCTTALMKWVVPITTASTGTPAA